jgi:hypothetical protein
MASIESRQRNEKTRRFGSEGLGGSTAALASAAGSGGAKQCFAKPRLRPSCSPAKDQRGSISSLS